jgi:hypothetical protein
VAFRGRVHGKLLEPGTYTIVPQAAAASNRPPRAVTVAIDVRGVRPIAPVRWQNCQSTAAALSSASTDDNGTPALTPRPSGVAAAETTERATNNGVAGKDRVTAFGWLPTIRKSPSLSALFLALLAVSVALLITASVEPGDMRRHRTVRVIARHQEQMAWLGGALLVTTILILLF